MQRPTFEQLFDVADGALGLLLSVLGRVVAGGGVAAFVFWSFLAPLPTVRSTLIAAAAGLIVGTTVVYLVPFFIALSAGRTVSESIRTAAAVRLIPRGAQPIGRVRHVVMAPVLALVLLFALPFGMWLPQENIGTRAGRLSGYVLSTNEVWTTVLSVDKRVTILKSTDVASREVCGQGEYESLATLIVGSRQPVGPPCGS